MTRKKRASRRPRSVTLLALVVLLVAVGNLLSVAAIASRRAQLDGLGLTLPPGVLLAHAALWGVAALLAGIGLLWLRPWARWGVIAGAPLYAVVIIARQVLFAPGSASRGKLPFTLGVMLLLVALIEFALTRPPVRRAFDDSMEPNEETH
jgi:hypothetical protein